MDEWLKEPKAWYSRAKCGCATTSARHPWVIAGTSLSGEYVHVCATHAAGGSHIASGALNKPFGNPEQLASLEQRVRDAAEANRKLAQIIRKHDWCAPSALDVVAERLDDIAAALANQQGAGDRPAIDYECESLEALRIVEKVAIFNGGLIADDLDKVITFIESMRAEVSSIYAAIPTLPITAETLEQATDAFIQFCYAFNSMIESAGDTQPAGDVGREG